MENNLFRKRKRAIQVFVIASETKQSVDRTNQADENVKGVLQGQYLCRHKNLSYLILKMMQAQIAALRSQ